MATDNAPQAFTFQTRQLQGFLAAWSGKSQREFVQHRFIQRKGALIEDMERAPQWMEAQLVWTGSTCAKDYADFKAAVDEDPRGLLIHPIAGRWQAFCQGPNESVDFSRGTNEIRATVAWIESELDQQVAKDTPDVATAAQNASGALVKAQTTVAKQMGALAKAAAFAKKALAAIDKASRALDTGIATLTSPVDYMRTTLGQISGIGSHVIGQLLSIQTKTNLLVQSANDFINTSSDLFSGGDTSPGGSTSTGTLMGKVQAAAADAQATLIATSPTPAGCADAHGDIDELVAACLVLVDALKKARPPVVLWTNPSLSDVLTIAVRKYPKSNPKARAQDIMQLNRIPNPAAVPAGFRMLIPSR